MIDDEIRMHANSDGGVEPTMARRRFLRHGIAATAAVGLGGFGYTLLEAGWLRVVRRSVRVPRLPRPFQGTTVALLSDIHHGPFTGVDYVKGIVERTNSLSPDLVMLAGDYVHRSGRYIRPCFQALSQLSSRWGVFGVMGNHDYWEGDEESRNAMARAGIVELRNTGTWLQYAGARLRLAGVGDLWTDRQDLDAALGDAVDNDTALLLSHNPDYVEEITDHRVGLVLSGHTHGGQVVLPLVGAPRVPSRFGQKYLEGLVVGPQCQVYVSRGLGTVTPPVRFCCRPEIVLLTLI